MSTPTRRRDRRWPGGITAALDCAREGAEVTLLEARGRLGGAAYSFERDELSVDNGQHVFLRCCTAYRDLVEELGAGRAGDVAAAAGGSRCWRPEAGAAGCGARSFPLRCIWLPRSCVTRTWGMRERIALAWAMQQLRSVDVDDPRQ